MERINYDMPGEVNEFTKQVAKAMYYSLRPPLPVWVSGNVTPRLAKRFQVFFHDMTRADRPQKQTDLEENATSGRCSS